MPGPDAAGIAGPPVRVGTRGSRLALAQTELVLSRLRAAHPGVAFELVIVTTQGDANRAAPLAGMGLGVFVSEIERRLAAGDIDLAVHSLKDMPTALPDGMAIGAIPERADPRDVLVCHLGHTLARLPAGARIGTSSPRRAAQIAEYRPDLTIVPIRGNVETRIRKAAGDECDGAILAAAGLHRLGLAGAITEYLPPDRFVPPPGQGAMAVEIRADDARMTALAAAAHHPPTAAAVAAERAFLSILGGGCQVPVGAYAGYAGSDYPGYAGGDYPGGGYAGGGYAGSDYPGGGYDGSDYSGGGYDGCAASDHPGDGYGGYGGGDDDGDGDRDGDRRRLNLTAYIAAPDGSAACRATVAGVAGDVAGLVAAAWELLRGQGADGLL